MTGPKYNVTPADFATAKQAFERCSTELQKTMHTLEGELLGHLLDRKKYMGAQANAFSRTYGIIRDEMIAANKELTLMSELVHTAAQKYGQADDTTSHDFNRVGSSVQGGGSFSSQLNPRTS